MSKNPAKPDIQGEGNYTAARAFQKEERAFVRSGRVDKAAREAEAALDGPEGEALERAREQTVSGAHRKAPPTTPGA